MRLLLPEPRELAGEDLLDLYDAGSAGVLRAGFVVSVDGGVAVDGTSRGLQTPADLVVYRALRSVCDAVVVGAGTARAEAYGAVRLREPARAWRAAHGRSEQPRLVVVTRSGELDDAQRAADPVVVSTARAAASLDGVDVLVAGDEDVDLRAAVVGLRERGLDRLLCEGGPALLNDLLAADLVDELCLTTSPLLLGAAPTLLPRPLAAPARLSLGHLVDGGDGSLLARWRVAR